MTPEYLFDLGRALSALAFGIICFSFALGIAAVVVLFTIYIAQNILQGLRLRRQFFRKASTSLSTSGSPAEEEA
jgi:hypothetical protein